MKGHEIRELVNQLRDVAIKYHGAGQLREQIARVVRAYMLQDQPDDDGEPTDDERIMAIEGIHNCERCGDEGWVVGEMGITRCACGQAGNSPVIPEGYVMVPKEPTEDMLQASYREAAVYSPTAYRAMIAAAPHDTPALNSLQSVDSIVGRWFPVSERMPENKPGCYKYLVFETLNNRVNHDYWNVPDKGDEAFTPFWNYYGEHVTHWQPLPAAPQEVGDA
ncbi:DUF551 domain-containing protein [Klebsiella michiganensis]|uniref:DUF551 domain-containing protein n=1 Tax=Klebsiella michiganensis TaxID=1134687 RepID=UPI0030D1398B